MGISQGLKNAIRGVVPNRAAAKDLIRRIASVGVLDTRELSYIDGVIPGAAEPLKAVVLDENEQIDSVDAKALRINGNPVTATAAQVNVLAGVTPGTAGNGKAVVLGPTGKIDALDVTALKINAVQVTDPTHAPPVANAAWSAPTAEENNEIALSLTLLDVAGQTIAFSAVVDVFISDAATGIGLAVEGPDGDNGTPGLKFINTGEIVGVMARGPVNDGVISARVQSGANGTAMVMLEHSNAASPATFRLVCVLPNGKQVVSGAIAFAGA